MTLYKLSVSQIIEDIIYSDNTQKIEIHILYMLKLHLLAER